jgi:S1-C subfamily serine protease/pSer/pThr/pTyr-binding forkhead associated (FHA) protein
VVLSGPRAGTELTFEGSLTIGRDPGSGLVLDDGKVSRQHARLRDSGATATITDEGSRNGTWVNDQRVEGTVELAHDDHLRIGSSEIRIEVVDARTNGTIPAGAHPSRGDADVTSGRPQPERVIRSSPPAEEPQAPAAEASPPVTPHLADAYRAAARRPSRDEISARAEASPPPPAAPDPPTPAASEAPPPPTDSVAGPGAPAAEAQATPGADGGPKPRPERLTTLLRFRRGGIGNTTLLRIVQGRLRRLTLITGAAVLAALALGGLALTGVLSGGSANELNVAAVVRTATPGTVLVNELATIAGSNRLSHGSGWVVDARRGEIVTNAHVAGIGTTTQVSLAGGRPRTAKVVAINACNDVALLKTRDTRGLRSLPLVAQSKLHEGDPVVALGFPGSLAAGDNLTTTTGVISVVNARDAGAPRTYPDVVQTDAAINPGNSGGPLLNADMKLVGMNTYANTTTQNQNYAIASDHIARLLPDLRAGYSEGWLGYALLEQQANAAGSVDPVVAASTGEKFYGPRVIGPAEGTPKNANLPGLAGGRQQYVYAIDGVRFGPGTNELSPTSDIVDDCRITRGKVSGDTSVLSVVEVDERANTYNTFDVRVRYR